MHFSAGLNLTPTIRNPVYAAFLSKYCCVHREESMEWKDISEKAVFTMFLHEFTRGVAIAVSHIFREPARINYPFEKGPLSPRFRGEHALRKLFIIFCSTCLTVFVSSSNL